MTIYYQDGRPKVEARVDEWFLEKLDSFCEDHDLTRSEVIREALSRYLPGDEFTNVPRDPALREAYLWLVQRADPDGRVPREYLSDLAMDLQIEKRYVISSRIAPLDREGWISVDWGRLMIARWLDE